MEVIYNNKSIQNGVFLPVIETQKQPEIKFSFDKSKKYVLIMYDPDAISGTYIHWIISDITDGNINNGIVLTEYKGPAPPAKTGKHRYIFELYEQDSVVINPIKERSMSIENIRTKLDLEMPIYKIQFISQNESGGKRYKTIKRKYKRIYRKIKRTKRKY
jgi:phosphatidylethanolamine-binding protein (PEBP) family uncharacterized protein